MPFLSSQIMEGIASARPSASSGGRLYFATDTGKIWYDTASSWVDVTPLSAVVSVAGKTGTVTLAESDITGLVSDLGGKAPTSRSISTTAPLTGGGDLSANRTLGIDNFTGDSGGGGAKGAVPGPASGDAAAGKFLKADGTWAVPTGTFSSPTTTKGDAIIRGASSDVRFPVGADGSVPTADSTATVGIAYKKQPYTVEFFQPGKPTAANLLAFRIGKIDGASITVTWASNFADSYGTEPATNATSTANIPVSKNGTQFGTISISTSGVFTFTTTSGAAQTAVSGDLIAFGNPLDATMSDFGFTLAATRK